MNNPISHGHVVAAMLAQDLRSTEASKKSLKSCCKRWCLSHGLSFDDPAELTLGETFEAKMSSYLEALQRSSSAKGAGKNVRSAAKLMRATFQALLATQDLPTDFNTSFRRAMDAKQLKPVDLNRILQQRYYLKERPQWYGSQLWGFYAGTARPGSCHRGSSSLLLTRCEEVLGLEPGALVSRAYPAPDPILTGAPTCIPYRKARSEQWLSKYALPKLPERIQRIWNQFIDWRRKERHYLNGELFVVEPIARWASQSTAKKHHRVVLRYFGWLCLPAADRPLSELPKEQRWLTGEGMQAADLRIGHLLDIALLWKFVEFQQFRQHKHEITKSHIDLLMLANSFVSCRYSFLVTHPEYAAEFGFEPPQSPEHWATAMESHHQQLLRVIRQSRRRLMSGQRSADEPLRHVMTHEAPYTLFLELLARMEKTPPLRALTQTWSIWARDVAIFAMQLEIPLRVRNLCDLRVRQHLTRDDQTGLWSLHVPKSELKNHFSGAAEDIRQTYSAEASKAMDRYYTQARPNLVGFGQTDAFLLGASSGRRADSKLAAQSDYKLSTDAAYNAVGKYLEKYFGNTQGTNVFRHVIATSILKEDPTHVDVAAAVLNNSPNSVRANYKHLVRSDGLRTAERWRKDQLARGSKKS